MPAAAFSPNGPSFTHVIGPIPLPIRCRRVELQFKYLIFDVGPILVMLGVPDRFVKGDFWCPPPPFCLCFVKDKE